MNDVTTTWMIERGRVKTCDSVAGLLANCFRCGSPRVGYALLPLGFSPTCISCGVDGPIFEDPLYMMGWWNGGMTRARVAELEKERCGMKNCGNCRYIKFKPANEPGATHIRCKSTGAGSHSVTRCTRWEPMIHD